MAKERKVEKIICTHVDSQLCFWDIEDQIEICKEIWCLHGALFQTAVQPVKWPGCMS